MNSTKLLEILHQAEKLKDTMRHSWTSKNRQESVAEHSWRMGVFAYFLKDEFPLVDIHKVILMCLFHDFGETFTGDIPIFQKNEAHSQAEEKLLRQWLDTLEEPYKSELIDLFQEMEECCSPEAKLYKAIDKLEVIDQHNLAEIDTWIDLEYELNLTHGTKQVAYSEKLQEIKEAINQETREKIRNEKRKSSLTLKVFEESFTVAQVEDYSKVSLDQPFTFIMKTEEENSLVVQSNQLPENTIKTEPGWKMLRVEGVLDFSLVGILAKIANCLTQEKISIFVISSYNTDMIFVKENELQHAMDTLQNAGYQVH